MNGNQNSHSNHNTETAGSGLPQWGTVENPPANAGSEVDPHL